MHTVKTYFDGKCDGEIFDENIDGESSVKIDLAGYEEDEFWRLRWTFWPIMFYF